MFKGIRWRFVLIYIVLLVTAMIVAHFFIIKNLEDLNLENLKDDMIAKTESIISASSALSKKNLLENAAEIQNMISQWGLSQDEKVYVIDMEKKPPIVIASSDFSKPIGDIYSDSGISSVLIDKAKTGRRQSGEYKDNNTDRTCLHLASPIFTNTGNLNGILYMTCDLSKVYMMLQDATMIIYRAILISLVLTVILGFFIANGITVPIRDVTKKASLMAEGDFNQKVEVKSDDEIGQLAQMFNILTEKLKKTLGEMELERSKLSTIFLHMQEGLLAIDNRGEIIHANPIAKRILNLPKEGYEGMEFPKEIKEDAQNNPDTLITIGGLVYRLQIAPYKEDDGEEAGKIIVFQDMTREHRLDEMRKEFVANVSHELKTPITTIITYVETILESTPDKDTERHFLETVSLEAERMNRIVKDLLALSNMDYEKNPWKRERHSLKTLLEDTVEKLSVLIKEKNHTVNMVLSEIYSEIDIDAMQRVFLNVISNSAKYTEVGGEISIKLEKSGENALITIKDNGIGIPASDLERVFERFYRVEKGRSRSMGGTGLGLSIAKEIVEGHGGTIKMSSVFGEGTETKILLPLC